MTPYLVKIVYKTWIVELNDHWSQSIVILSWLKKFGNIILIFWKNGGIKTKWRGPKKVLIMRKNKWSRMILKIILHRFKHPIFWFFWFKEKYMIIFHFWSWHDLDRGWGWGWGWDRGWGSSLDPTLILTIIWC